MKLVFEILFALPILLAVGISADFSWLTHPVDTLRKLFLAKPGRATQRLAELRALRTCSDSETGISISGQGYTWELLTDSAPYQPRDGAGGVVLDGRMYLMGGWNPNDRLHFPRVTRNDVWVSTDGRTWKKIKPNTFLDGSFDPAQDWEGRHSTGYVVFEEKIWIIGGDANQGSHQSDIWNSKNGVDWTLVNDGRNLPWKPRALHLTFVFNNRIFVVGGQTMHRFIDPESDIDDVYYNDVWSTTDGIDWIKHHTNLPTWSPRGGIGGNLVFRDRIWIVGGFTYDNDVSRRRVYSDIWSSPDGNDWKKECDIADWAMADGGLEYHDIVTFDDKLWVIGGYKRTSGNSNEIWYSDDGIRWNQLKSSPIAATHSTTLFSFGDSLIIAAGNHMNREVWRLSRTSDEIKSDK
jgi:hypothetical protein